MRTPVPDYLSKVLRSANDNSDGALADYIPELANVDPERLAVALCVGDGKVYAAGDTEAEFTNQSMSKPFVYALALRDRGLEEVLSRVGVEPSGDPFNEMSLGEDGRPSNPMINSGAIATHSLIGGPDVAVEDKFELVRQGLSAFAGRELEVDEAVFESEMSTSSRNMAFAHMLRHHDMVDQPARDSCAATRCSARSRSPCATSR